MRLYRFCVRAPIARAMLVGMLSFVAPVQADTGRNTNIVGPTPIPADAALFDAQGRSFYVPDSGMKQQNEASCAVRPDIPEHLICSYNDYRIADDPDRGGDAWQGVSMSRDGGLTWVSRLAPGFIGYRANEGYSLGYEFAADPTVVAVPGMAFLNFISKNRGSGNDGGLYLQYWWDTNRETQFPWQPDPSTIQIAKGTSGQFIDLPNLLFNINPNASDIVVSGQNEIGEDVSRTIPGGELVVAYTIFPGNDNNNGTKIVVRRSSDAGRNWSQGFKVSESVEVNQGVTLAADPNGNDMVLVWRRFSDPNDPNADLADAIMYATSSDRGRRWSKAKVLRDLQECAFDHPSTEATFRSNGYPTLVHDGTEFRAYWAERVDAGLGCSNGLSRIHSAALGGGNKWSSAELVDPALANGGHQYMPAAFVAKGVTQLAYMDTRNDLIVDAFAQALPDPAAGLTIELNQQTEFDFLADLLNLDPNAPTATITGETLRDAKYIFDFNAETEGGMAVFRHTGDVRGAKRENGTFAASEQISKYLLALDPQNSQNAVVLEHNWLNPRLFKQGSFPFNGDYLWATAKAFRKDANGNWESNITDDGGAAPSFLVTWGDNREVRGDVWLGDPNLGNRTQYGPPNMAAAPLDDPTPDFVPMCNPSDINANPLDLTRNQNVYSAMLRPDFVAGTASAVKPLIGPDGTVQRAYVLTLSNRQGPAFPDDPGRIFRIKAPERLQDAVAKFNQFDVPGENPAQSVDALVAPLSEAARTLFVEETGGVARPLVPVDFFEVEVDSNGIEVETFLGSVVLNENEATAELENVPGALADILSIETHQPEILALFPGSEEGELVFRGVSSFNFENPTFINFELETPTFLNPTFLNPTFLNPTFLNPTFLNPTFLNPTFLNPTFLNPTFLNPTFLNEPIGDLATTANDSFVSAPAAVASGAIPAAATDVTFVFTNTGNTTTAYSLSPFVNGSPDATQLIGSRIYMQPSSEGCQTGFKLQNQVVFNIINPQLSSDSNPELLESDGDGVGTLFLSPGDVFTVTVRLWGDDNFDAERVGLNTYSQACDTNQINQDCDQARPQDGVGELDITAPELAPNQGPLGEFDVNAPGGANIPPAALPITVTDGGDDNPALICMVESQECSSADECTLFFPVNIDGGSTDVDCVGQDAVGNVSEPNGYSLQVIDDVAPTFVSVPSSVEVSGAGPTEIVSFSVVVDDLGDPGVVPVCTPASGSEFGVGDTAVSCVAQDASGNAATTTFNVRVNDNVPPVLSVPDTVIVSGAGPQVVATYAVSAADLGDPNVQALCSPPSGAGFDLGDTTVNCSATDVSGNTATASFIVRVLDNVPPQITTPGVVSVDAAGATSVSYAVSVLDAGDSSPSLACVPASGSVFALGATTVTCTASDQSGNTSATQFVVNVNDLVAPVITVPESVNVDTTEDSTIVSYSVSATDQGDPVPAVVCQPPSGSSFALGSTQVSCSATDVSGNSTSASFAVVVGDVGAPVLSVPADQELQNTGSAFYQFSVQASDNSGAVEVACLADNNVVLTPQGLEFSGTFTGNTQVTCSATDASGNTSTESFSVLVKFADFVGLLTPNGQVAEGEEQKKPVNRGSSLPLTWQYALDGVVIDSSGADPQVEESVVDCASGGAVSAGFPGNSDLRYKASSDTWQLNWATPEQKGCYALDIEVDGQINGPFLFRVK